jgi:superfamily II DNA or RNA helicase
MERRSRGWDAIAPKDRLLIGVTATPNRTDAIGLGCVFQTIAYSYA